jgi:hypothetical protein
VPNSRIKEKLQQRVLKDKLGLCQIYGLLKVVTLESVHQPFAKVISLLDQIE